MAGSARLFPEVSHVFPLIQLAVRETALECETDSQTFEAGANLVRLFNVFDRDVFDGETRVGNALDQSISFQPQQRLADGGATHRQGAAEFQLDETCAGGELTFG